MFRFWSFGKRTFSEIHCLCLNTDSLTIKSLYKSEPIANNYDEAQMLQFLREEPDDLTRRLVYADWLEDQGDSQAEFIRIQCQLADAPWTLNSLKLRTRAANLFRLNRSKWDHRLHAILNRTSLREFEDQGILFGWKYSRGCVERILMLSTDLEEHLSAALQIGPVNQLQIVKGGKRSDPFEIGHLKSATSLIEIHELDLSEISQGTRFLDFIISSPDLFGNLRTIRFASSRAGRREFWYRGNYRKADWYLESMAKDLFQLRNLKRVEFHAIGKVQTHRREEFEHPVDQTDDSDFETSITRSRIAQPVWARNTRSQ